MDSRSVLLANAAATAALGAELAQLWLRRSGDAEEPQILLLEGTLGAGKTSLVQGIAAALAAAAVMLGQGKAGAGDRLLDPQGLSLIHI